jgi:hypothetical protein
VSGTLLASRISSEGRKKNMRQTLTIIVSTIAVFIGWRDD